MTGFYSSHKTDENFKSLYGSGGRCLKIRDVCIIGFRLELIPTFQHKRRRYVTFQPNNFLKNFYHSTLLTIIKIKGGGGGGGM